MCATGFIVRVSASESASPGNDAKDDLKPSSERLHWLKRAPYRRWPGEGRRALSVPLVVVRCFVFSNPFSIFKVTHA
jgi:hypothetical protein